MYHWGMRQLLFKVSCPDGREYAIYTNGEIEGFGEGASVFNYYPALLVSDRNQRPEKGMSFAPSGPTTVHASDLAGAVHSRPR